MPDKPDKSKPEPRPCATCGHSILDHSNLGDCFRLLDQGVCECRKYAPSPTEDVAGEDVYAKFTKALEQEVGRCCGDVLNIHADELAARLREAFVPRAEIAEYTLHHRNCAGRLDAVSKCTCGLARLLKEPTP